MKIKTLFFTLLCLLVFNNSVRAQSSLATGTQITMANDTKKAIDEIVVGDIVLSFNIKDKVYEEDKVKSIEKIMYYRLVRVTLESGVQLTMTADYPIWAEKGWISVDPDQTSANGRNIDVKRCQIGDFVLFYNITSTDYIELSTIQGVMEPTQAYMIELEGRGTIIANGFLVGQKQ
ncbi:hypothetical protein JGH11_06695 [Dysgonomonas sp. Marseille-P4677]|uniref:Hint domain-containing protein n=1 Tax=Dysgonomonas sp. Marseille-P4677 TaxID=2364790 RepID=UPI0019148021|nr:Hint domain-containing protein [Dysgonomonas sp. Marseille-P4677]MBK5720555.1 hypothetical protein [Dysgonomonas sp. Marseille-P4677]